MLRTKNIHIYLWGGLEARTAKLARALQTAGANVSVHAWPAEQLDPVNYDFAVEYHLFPQTKQSFNPSRGKRIAANIFYYRPQNKRILHDQIFFCSEDVKNHISKTKPDLAIAVNSFMLKGVAEGAKITGIPFAYETYEFWPDHVFDPLLNLEQPRRKFLYHSEKKYINDASLVVTVSDYLAEQYQQEFNLKNKPSVIYNAPTSCAEKSTPAHKSLRVLFLGNIQQERNVEYIVRAVAQSPGVELTFLGKGSYKQALENLVSELGVEDQVLFKDPVPYGQIAEVASQYDMGVVCHKAYNRQMEGALPNKFFEYMAGGLAVVAPRTEAFTRIENFDSFGAFVNPCDVASLRNILLLMKQNPDELTRRKKAALIEARKYCGPAREESIIKLYESISD